MKLNTSCRHVLIAFGLLLLLCACGGGGGGADATSAQNAAVRTNYKTGIDTTFGGTQGRDWAIEQLFYDPLIKDSKVVYIKSTTAITLAHNSRNVSAGDSATPGNPFEFSSSYLPTTGANVGVIRYKIDRDLQWGRSWGDSADVGSSVFYDFSGNQVTVPEVDNPAYVAPFTFASLTYDGATAVVGATGPTGTITDVANYYWRGITDSVGDEWHVLTVADDDSAFNTNIEQRSSDGKVILFVVNPKTPCLTITTTGDAQFYTTPPKNYFIPKINNQTTYFSANTGAVTFTLHDINGNNTFYRINGGNWSSGAPTVTLAASNFNAGTNTLEYYYAGKQANTKTRIVVKNPDFPSAGEYFVDGSGKQVSHGELLWGAGTGAGNWDTITHRIAREPYASKYLKFTANDFTNPIGKFATYYRTGNRTTFGQYAINSALVAKKEGWEATPFGDTTSYAQYAKRMLLDNERNLDPVGFEISHSLRSLPTRELFYRGYYDVNVMYSLAFAYDVLIANYKSTQHTGGITPIEDYFIRDMLAGCSFEAMMQEGNYSGKNYRDTGMWGTARNTGGLITALAIPSYSTPYFGTSGFNGTTTVYPWTPFPDSPLTWKKVFFDNNAPLVGYPNLQYRFGIDEYNFTSDGDFKDKVDYMVYWCMGHVFATTENILELYFPGKNSLPRLDAAWLKNAKGTMYGVLERDEWGPRGFAQITTYNSRFAAAANIGKPWMKAQETGYNSEDHALYGAGAYGLVWYDDIDTPYAVPGGAKVAGQ